MPTNQQLSELAKTLDGTLFYDDTMRTLYATDASAYREMPTAVVFPKNEDDILKIIRFANEHKCGLIPRTAGTSLAGQVVGNGIIVDVSKHFTAIKELNLNENWIKVQPGVIRDELNTYLRDYNLFYGPETSTSNRCMIGGMVGNNSCGSRSVIYGSAREHLIEVKGYLSNGEFVTFKPLSKEAFMNKMKGDTLEAKIYRDTYELLKDEEVQAEIDREFPKPSVPRRNTGYAIDMLTRLTPFKEDGDYFNFCQLLAGSEGTLFFMTEIKLNLVPAPPKENAVVCVHFNSVNESLKANIIALMHNPSACELIDHYILDCTKKNIEQSKNRFFIEGDPKAILVVEFPRETREEVDQAAQAMEEEMRAAGLGYHFPIVYGDDINKVWTLRKAGLGLLSNIPGDAKAVAVIEDTAVDVNDLPEFIEEFNQILDENNLYCVHYAHAGSGELHLRPIIDLKTAEGNRLFKLIATEIAHLVKKYKGSLSGEHGDGRLRGEFIPFMIGEKNYELIKKVKNLWDPNHIFNPNKIVDTPAMNTSLRYDIGQETPEFDTAFSFEDTQGIVRAAELCNGSADCRKTEITGGTMCPSYMATREEKHTTRARANILREVLTKEKNEIPFASGKIKDVMDLCLSCKGCKSECPSNVDVAKLKSESLHQYYQVKGIPLRAKMFAQVDANNKKAYPIRSLYNFATQNAFTGKLIKSFLGVAPERTLPALSKISCKAWYNKHKANNFGFPKGEKGTVYLFCDEFVNYNEAEIGITTIQLLSKLGYQVIIPEHVESGRAFISKGLLNEAKSIANKNIEQLHGLKHPIVGIEPSAILTLRDEYLSLATSSNQDKANQLAQNTFLIDEFLAEEFEKGNIQSEQFVAKEQRIRLHGHCHQKALSSVVPTKKILSIPRGYQVLNIPSGCCGMAGSFGYEKEHYEVSMKVGNLVLFPTIKKEKEDVIIAAPGTSCRHQIKDGTSRQALHPIEILYQALK